jgi:hypothetical protein
MKRGDPCTICGKPMIGRGWCSKHYERWRIHGDPLYEPPGPEERFLAKIERAGPLIIPELGVCWLWTGGTDKDGYGKFQVEGRAQRAHRWGYSHFVGDPGPGLVAHRCDNPPCVRWEGHLFSTTPAGNMDDKVSKGRQAAGRRHGMVVLTAAQALDIRASSDSQRALAALYGVDKSTIGRIRRGETWSHQSINA